MAAVEDRSPNLVGFIVDLLDADISEYLRRQFAMHPDAQVVTDSHVRPASMPNPRHETFGELAPTPTEVRQAAWERGWGVYTQVGYLARVALKVTDSEPPVLHMFVSDVLVLSRTPDWIANRRLGSDSGADRETFRTALIEALAKGVMPENR